MVTSDDVGGEFKPERGVFVNRTLNMRSVEAVGYDMDYTLIHYNVDMWEGAAFDEARDILSAQGYPVAELQFDPEQFTIGLVFDLKLGNVVKATRFGYVVRAQHGNELLTFEEQRDVYREDIVELSSSRFEFMNTLFELSRASLFTQLVALLDAKLLDGVRDYFQLYDVINEALGEAHMAGLLKAKIVADPDRFVDLDKDIVATLLDQRRARKKLALITNSDWAYTSKMMNYAVDPYCPDGTTWRDLFDVGDRVGEQTSVLLWARSHLSSCRRRRVAPASAHRSARGRPRVLRRQRSSGRRESGCVWWSAVVCG